MITHSHTSSLLRAASLAIAAPALAADLPAILIDRGLAEQRVTLQAISSESLTYVDARGLVRSEPAEGYLAVIVEGSVSPAGAWIELTDARRFSGALAQADDPGSIAWDHPALGELAFSLDDVRRVRFSGDALAASPEQDLALLTNGDRLAGFVESIGGSLAMSIDDATVTTPIDRVACVVLANPEVPPSGARLWLADGSVLAVESFECTRVGEMVIALAGDATGSDARARVDASTLRAAAWSAEAIVPLAGIAPRRVEPIERRWTRPPTSVESDSALLAADILLPGPMRVAWALPAGASRFACRVTLPPDARRWGDAEFSVSAGGAELARVRVNADAPEHAINVELPRDADELLVVLDPGAFGPVQDRVVLGRPMISRGR